MSNLVYGKNSFLEALNSDRILKAYVLKDSSFIKELDKKHIAYTEGYGAINEAEGIISAIDLGNGQSRLLVSVNEKGKYSQIIAQNFKKLYN